MDGYGIAPRKEGAATLAADTPYIDKVLSEWPTAQLTASGEGVGLPEGQMGNSEVGHLNLGAGRVVYQDFTRINLAVENKELLTNDEIQRAAKKVKENDSCLHLIGLLSDGGVHSHIKHVFGLLDMAKEAELPEVKIHAILDGRDTPPRSAKKYIKDLEDYIAEIGLGEIVTVSGRYYTMDRDNRWDRTELAYKALVLGEGHQVSSALEAVEEAYARDENDEFVEPTVVNPAGTINDQDSVIFFNFRADRARQITQALALKDFAEFDRPAEHPEDLYYVCMTEYDEEFPLPVAFKPATIEKGLGEILSLNNMTQLRIAETEKYAHVTYFFNGGEEKSFPGEDRELIPSPQEVATYDLKPEMSAPEVTERLQELLAEDKYDVIILNYANCDMVGHTGFFDAAVAAVEAVDRGLSQVIPAILEKGGQVLLTADHGNAEQMLDEEGEPFTAHTSNPVPLAYIGGPKDVSIKEGILADIAPTMLDILGLEKPEEMTGDSLLD